MNEYLEIFDDQNQPLNQKLPRRTVHELGYWHRTAQVYVLNDKNELLCNLRSPHKDLFPMFWDVSIGGHLDPGETFEACALRELKEELGKKVEPEKLRFLTSTKFEGEDKAAKLQDREHTCVYVYKTDLLISDFNFQQEEIVQLQYLPLEKVKEYLCTDQPEVPFIPRQEHYLANLEKIEKLLDLQ